MGLLSLAGLPETRSTGAFCASVPGAFIHSGDVSGAGEALRGMAELAGEGLIPNLPVEDLAKGASGPDLEGNLWFIRAVHLYQLSPGDAALYQEALLPLVKRIIQAIISGAAGGFAGARMDDGGMLIVEGAWERTTRLNALWYNAIESISQTLRAGRDPSGDHFERLAGRFRRSFAKAFWCESDGIICTPELRKVEGHRATLPDVEQLLFVILPTSPIPKTKQRSVLQALRERTVGNWGLRLQDGTESVLHRAWLADAWASQGEYRGQSLSEGRALIEPVKTLLGGQRKLAVAYRDGQPLGEGDTFVTAEVSGIVRKLQAG